VNEKKTTNEMEESISQAVRKGAVYIAKLRPADMLSKRGCELKLRAYLVSNKGGGFNPTVVEVAIRYLLTGEVAK